MKDNEMANMPSVDGYDDIGEFDWDLTTRTEQAFRLISRSLMLGKVGRKAPAASVGQPAADPVNASLKTLRATPRTSIILAQPPGGTRHRCLAPEKKWNALFNSMEAACGTLEDAAVLAERAVLRLTALEAIEYLTAADFLKLEVDAGTLVPQEVDVTDLDSVAGELARSIECSLRQSEEGGATYRVAAVYQRWVLAVAAALIQHGRSDSSSLR